MWSNIALTSACKSRKTVLPWLTNLVLEGDTVAFIACLRYLTAPSAPARACAVRFRNNETFVSLRPLRTRARIVRDDRENIPTVRIRTCERFKTNSVERISNAPYRGWFSLDESRGTCPPVEQLQRFNEKMNGQRVSVAHRVRCCEREKRFTIMHHDIFIRLSNYSDKQPIYNTRSITVLFRRKRRGNRKRCIQANKENFVLLFFNKKIYIHV